MIIIDKRTLFFYSEAFAAVNIIREINVTCGENTTPQSYSFWSLELKKYLKANVCFGLGRLFSPVSESRIIRPSLK